LGVKVVEGSLRVGTPLSALKADGVSFEFLVGLNNFIDV
jgi:hypothetical protein